MTTRRFVSPGTVVVAGALLAVALGLALVAGGTWRPGLALAGGAMALAGGARLVLSARLAGPLRVRRARLSDAGVMLALGVTLLVLAVVVPDQPPAG